MKMKIFMVSMRMMAAMACFYGLIACTQDSARLASEEGEAPEPSSCVSDATIRVEAGPPAIMLGQTSEVRWHVGLPNGCANARIRLDGQAVGESGSRIVSPVRTTTFTVVVSHTRLGTASQKSGFARVEVAYPQRVVIGPSTPAPVSLLLGVLRNSTNEQQTIELCGVDLDLTGHSWITIGSNRSLIASPECARGPRRLGPRIFVTDRRGKDPLFRVWGDNVRISGFRLEGPTTGLAQGDIKERGILVWPFEAAEPIRAVEISNMEVFHWSGAGVEVRDNTMLAERGRLFNTLPGAVRITNNFFHHNRHGAGYGYGVNVGNGGYALIDRNVFDENRHAISGDSRNEAADFSGYTARDNLILPGGGKHCSEAWYWTLTGRRFNCWQTHQVDMHGDGNRWYSDNNWLCGTAGETILIERNTILYTSGHAIKIRGNPADKAVVGGNVFKNSSRSDAITQNGSCGWGDNITNPIQMRPNNVFDFKPLAAIGSCDFFGDGRLDQFMATGVTWWAKSPVTQQWRYLNTMAEKLPQLQLGRIDGDPICDVALRTAAGRPRIYSRSGTGPWRRLLGVPGKGVTDKS